jgi:hypothetical protein
MLSRRQLLAVSPVLLALSACHKPAVLAAPPVPTQQTQTLLHAVSAEQDLVSLYDRAVAAYPALAATLTPLRAEHAAHLAQLRGRVIEPPGKTLPGTVAHEPAVGATEPLALAQLRDAEQGAVTAQMARLDAASASLAQLYASIAASEATHARVLSARIPAK